MSRETRLSELLQQWQEAEARQAIRPEELCKDCPELLDDLKRHIAVQRRFQALFVTPTGQAAPEAAPTAKADHRDRIDARSAQRAVEEPPRLPGFDFLRCLGRGGFGEVWLARDLELQTERAIKRLREDCYPQPNLDELTAEARLMARLPRHRHRVQVHALIRDGGSAYLVLEYVAGGPLSELVSPQTPLSWERAARYVAEVAEGLSEVHAAGILHRDIKPANILWDRQRDEALLSDFGISAHADQIRSVAGTAGYLAPELLDGQASAKSDIFALAVTLFHLVTGQLPFDLTSLAMYQTQVRTGLDSPVAALRHVPRVLETAILAGLEPDPNRRADLPTFLALLRGAHLQGLADRLLELSRRSASPTRLRVTLATAKVSDLDFRPAPWIRPKDVDKGEHELATSAAVCTSDLVRFEVTADADGYLTLLNFGSTGRLTVTFPNPLARDNRIRAGQPHRLIVKLTPPAGTDRAVLIWTRRPTELTPAEWRERIEAGQGISLPRAEATRGMDFVLHQAGVPSSEEWAAAVVTIAHRPA